MKYALHILMTFVEIPLLAAVAQVPNSCREDTKPVPVAAGVQYEFIGRYEVDRLNQILTTDAPTFTHMPVTYTPARNAVRMYRITYPSVIPERNNRPTVASGLIVIPETTEKSLPMVSYQHGTVMEKLSVPSFHEQSPETQLMIAQFAGQGYVVIGADYFGLGTSTEQDGYMVMASHQQACMDMYRASLAVLANEGIAMKQLFLTGWSQGGVVSMGFLETLEKNNIAVAAASTACAQCDGFVMLSGFLNHPRPIDAPWVSAMFILTAFSYEEYYGVPGLAKALFTEEQYELARRIYMKEAYTEPWPGDLHKLIRKEYFDPNYFAGTAYGNLIQKLYAYRWQVKTNVRMYYGEIDECLTNDLARLPSIHQRAMGNTQVEAISSGADANHRGTYARAVAEWKKWFDSMRAQTPQSVSP